MNELVLASHNESKIKEFSGMFKHFKVISSKALGFDDVEETGLTYVENAIIKARYCSKLSQKPCLADDSGLEIDALNQEPGVLSARYSGKDKNSSANIQKVLDRLQGVPLSKRQGRFRCVLVWMRHAVDPAPIIVEGVWEGFIALEASGQKGFGYDPVFWCPAQNKMAAELPLELKNTLSHRAIAKQNLLRQLTSCGIIFNR